MRTIGMIIPDGTNQYFSSLAQKFQSELSNEGDALIVVDSNSNRSHELQNIALLKKMNVDGLVFISVGDNGDATIELSQIGIPLLVIDREIPVEQADFLMSQDSKGVKEGLRYLHSQGHTDIAMIKGNMNTEPARNRHQSFIEWHQEQGFEINPKFVFDGDFMIGSGIQAAKNILLLRESERPTAIFASNDIMAIGLQFELIRKGYNIPKDFSILGFDDIIFCSWIHPKLTTIRQQIDDMAKTGVELINSRLKEVNANSKIKMIDTKLIIRDSILKI